MAARRSRDPQVSADPGLEFSLADLASAVRRHIWLGLSVFLLVLGLAAAYGMSRTRIYRAAATMQIDPKPPAPLGRGVEGVVELGTGSYWANVEYYNTQHELIRSLPVARAAVLELGLHHDATFLSGSLDPPRPSLVDTLSEPARVDLAARLVRSGLSVSPTKESRLVHVSFDDPHPRRASRVLDAVLRAYVAHNVSRAVESTSSAVEWLGEQLEGLRHELGESELALHEYKLNRKIASVGIDDQTGMLKREIAQLAERRTSVRTKIQSALARVTQLGRVEVSRPESIPQTELLASTELDKLRTEYLTSVREKRALQSGGKGERHPEVLAVAARVETTRAALIAEVQNIKDGAQKELDALRQEEGGLRALLDEAEKKALELNLMEIEYNRLRRTKENNEKLYGLVLERSKEAGLTQALKVNNIHVLSPAVTGGIPVEPRMAVILAAGALAGLALGLLGALGREQLDRTIKSLDELEKRVHLTPLGSVPQVDGARAASPSAKRRKRRGLAEAPEHLVQNHPTGAFAESIRGVRTNLLLMSPDQPFRRILVTSAGPAEGKTTIICSLAIAMAQAGHKVLLLDCDLRKPRLHEVFQRGPSGAVPLRSTLGESLLDATRLDRTSLRTDIERLSVLPAGPCPPNPTELLHSEAFNHLLETLQEEFDILLLDSPPLVVSDAAILSTRVDGAILVARAGRTNRTSLARAARSIRTVGGNVIGGLLNADRTSAGYGYGYGYAAPYGGQAPLPD